MNIQSLPLLRLKEKDYNPRVDLKPGDPEFENIKNSIEEFGYVQPIIVNQRFEVLSGHQRRKVLMHMGHTEAECVVIADMEPEQEKALVLAMNKVSGKWDEEKLYGLLSDLDTDMFELTGFSDIELERLELKFDDNIPDDLGLEKENSETAQGTTKAMTFGGIKCKISDEEYRKLADLYHEYSDINSTDFGFITWVLRRHL